MLFPLFTFLSYNVRKRTFDKYVITKTYLYNFDPLKPHFNIVKLGFTGVYIIFVTSAVLTSTHNLCFEQKYEKYQNFLSEKLSFFGCKIFSVFE